MTYLQSKPIAPMMMVGPNGIFQTERNQSLGSNEEEDGSEDPVECLELLDTNKMIKVIRKIQIGARAVHVSFNAMNK